MIINKKEKMVENNMNILMYGNGGAKNHGCEAIYRGTIEFLDVLNRPYMIYSSNTEEDCIYGLQEYATIKAAKSEIQRNKEFLIAYLQMKILNNDVKLDGLYYKKQIKRAVGSADVALSCGGDNYCYSGTEIYAYLNREYHRNGIKTVLWGCSVEPEIVKDKTVAKDLASYNLIVARESITYSAIRKVNLNTIKCPDPAFYMSAKECKIINQLLSNNVVGINLSPMIISNEKKKGITFENYRRLVKYILENTDCYIAFIPHVVWKNNDDRVVLRQLYKEFNRNSRLIMIEDHTAPELKYIISKCRIFIGARTHATIAAYSSYIPTIVIGYSVKARGIAKDIFGSLDNYVLPVQQLYSPDDLTNKFIKIYNDEHKIRQHLKDIMPEYLAEGQRAISELKKILS